MKDCKHRLQEVIKQDGARVQVCLGCTEIMAKWDINSNKLSYELPPIKS